jgi:hypothetical protein
MQSVDSRRGNDIVSCHRHRQLVYRIKVKASFDWDLDEKMRRDKSKSYRMEIKTHES